MAVGIDAARKTLLDWLAAFSDLHLVSYDLVVDGDHLMARLLLTNGLLIAGDRGLPFGRRSTPAREPAPPFLLHRGR